MLRALGTGGLAPALSTAAAGDPTDGVGGFYQDYVPYTCSDSERNYAEVSEEGPYDVENAEEYVVDLGSEQDGENVQIGVVRLDPDEVDDAPVIVRATPYVEDLRETNVAEAPTGPTAPGSYGFGPVEVSVDGGDRETVSGTGDTNHVVGAETTILETQ